MMSEMNDWIFFVGNCISHKVGHFLEYYLFGVLHTGESYIMVHSPNGCTIKFTVHHRAFLKKVTFVSKNTHN